MKSTRPVAVLAVLCGLAVAVAAQDMAPPIPQKLVVHSNVLNEDPADEKAAGKR
jgi:hypothetical protein